MPIVSTEEEEEKEEEDARRREMPMAPEIGVYPKTK